MKTIQDTFTASEAAQLAGMNIETLRVWRRRDYFTLEGERDGGWTRFTFADVLKVASFAATVGGHGSHVLAEVIAANSPEQFAKLLAADQSSQVAPKAICFTPANAPTEFMVVNGYEEFVPAAIKALQQAPSFFALDYLTVLEGVMRRLHQMNGEAAD